MTARIRQEKDIRKIKLFPGQDNEFKISQLADDNTFPKIKTLN